MKINFPNVVGLVTGLTMYVLALVGFWMDRYSSGIVILLLIGVLFAGVVITAIYNRIKFGVFFVNKLKK